eukprot:Hpha_TRINITY_DN14770_c1_g1::TRINITY_DN14770_c1_g1_i1::g.103072::m.103072
MPQAGERHRFASCVACHDCARYLEGLARTVSRLVRDAQIRQVQRPEHEERAVSKPPDHNPAPRTPIRQQQHAAPRLTPTPFRARAERQAEHAFIAPMPETPSEPPKRRRVSPDGRLQQQVLQGVQGHGTGGDPPSRQTGQAGSLPECAICFEPLGAAAATFTLSCGHLFHVVCLYRQFNARFSGTEKRCGTCGGLLGSEELRIIHRRGLEEQQRRARSLLSTAQQTPQLARARPPSLSVDPSRTCLPQPTRNLHPVPLRLAAGSSLHPQTRLAAPMTPSLARAGSSVPQGFSQLGTVPLPRLAPPQGRWNANAWADNMSGRSAAPHGSARSHR